MRDRSTLSAAWRRDRIGATGRKMLVSVATMGAALSACGTHSAPVTAPRLSTPLPGLPAGWPTSFELGLADAPGGATALERIAPFGFRYQYLAGGVNTGQGWS